VLEPGMGIYASALTNRLDGEGGEPCDLLEDGMVGSLATGRGW
jgi:hypothetical protein